MVIKTLKEYIELQLDLFLLLKVPHKKLTRKPRQVYVEHILCQLRGMDINSAECIEHMRDKFEFFSNADVWGYRWRLFNQGWFIKDEQDKYKLIPNFNLTSQNFKTQKTYKFTVRLDEKDSTT